MTKWFNGDLCCRNNGLTNGQYVPSFPCFDFGNFRDFLTIHAVAASHRWTVPLFSSHSAKKGWTFAYSQINHLGVPKISWLKIFCNAFGSTILLFTARATASNFSPRYVVRGPTHQISGLQGQPRGWCNRAGRDQPGHLASPVRNHLYLAQLQTHIGL